MLSRLMGAEEKRETETNWAGNYAYCSKRLERPARRGGAGAPGEERRCRLEGAGSTALLQRDRGFPWGADLA